MAIPCDARSVALSPACQSMNTEMPGFRMYDEQAGRGTITPNINDSVLVTTPNGDFPGVIKRILPDYAWTGDTWYFVRGPAVETIARVESIKVETGE